MALFKVNRGRSENLPVEKHNGWAYFCTDTAEFFIDYEDDNQVLQRKQINADEAKKLAGYDIATALELEEFKIPTSKIVKTYVDNAVAQKSLVQIITWEADD